MPDHRLIFPARRRVELEAYETHTPAPGEVRVRTTLSLMSTGTENIVFNGAFAAGTHFDRIGALPFRPGYLAVGVVEEVGDGVDMRPGQRIVHRNGHGTRFTVPQTAVTAIPRNVPDEWAVWATMAKIALQATRVAPFGLGDDVVIIGAGPVGQMAVRWAKAAGCRRIVAVSRTPFRLEWARRGGATHTVAAPFAEAAAAVAAACGGPPPVIIDTTGEASVLQHALGQIGMFGTVVLLGDTGFPGEQRLTSDVIIKGVTIVGVRDRHHRNGFSETQSVAYVLDLMADGRLDCGELITHRFPAARAADAYRLVNEERRSTLGVAFTWDELVAGSHSPTR
ncbi:zinc-binding alcohol dehydrogenase [Streptomyces sp. NPDC052020]|uniref:zinc-dependent alcohol dehydrogenase n=1 Tax=Streptomyces sp. NPDC052020 TaxID=3155677 RepID=UPI003436ABC1